LKLFPESRPFFLIRQLTSSSCFAATGQQQEEKFSLTPTSLRSSYWKCGEEKPPLAPEE